jgi:hypothetical protein
VSQVAAKKRLSLQNERVRVVAQFEEEGSVLAGTQQGTVQGFAIELSLEGDQDVDEIIQLIRMAHRMCFTESVLTQAIEVKTSHLFNGQSIDVDK